eukprot:3541772-Rhodomonas_salina.1
MPVPVYYWHYHTTPFPQVTWLRVALHKAGDERRMGKERLGEEGDTAHQRCVTLQSHMQNQTQSQYTLYQDCVFWCLISGLRRGDHGQQLQRGMLRRQQRTCRLDGARIASWGLSSTVTHHAQTGLARE